MNNEYDVIIIGGGITGAGTARDCAMRGLKVLLIERNDIATGATGRNHGLLHSGARYAVTDRESAAECISENMILKKIAKHCVEDCSGLFITLPEDDLAYQAKFIESCKAAGISAEAIDPKEAIRMEPSVNPALIGAVKVPDGSVDVFKLCSSNIYDAKLHGATVLLYHEVEDFIIENGKVLGVNVIDKTTKERKSFRAPVTVNACGIWGHLIAKKAGVNIGMFPAKGALLVFSYRVNKMVINRCRKPANADILVPGDTVTIIGTTSTRVPFEDCDHISVTQEEAELLLSEGSKLAPALADTRILRAYAGVRPLVADDSDPSGRSISRGIVCIDHKDRDGLDGFISITGGKLMTYRLMAEMATDAVCRKLGVDRKCETAHTSLPDILIPRHSRSGHLVCECESVTETDVRTAISNLDVNNMVDLRRRTRVGMGTCQGELCSCRAAEILSRIKGDPAKARTDLQDFVCERWKGMYPVAWGEALRENELNQWVQSEVLGL